MNRILIIFLFLVMSSFVFQMYGDGGLPNQIHIEQRPNGGTHQGQPLFPADQPDVYYDNVAQVVIIDGTGYSIYYDVDIFSCDDGQLMIHDTVNGYYDTVDVSTLPDDDYEIVITSSYNNVFEGYFTM